jgi:hypothetical protein
MRSKNWQQKDKPPPEGGASMSPGEARRISAKVKKASLHRPPLLSLIQFRNGLKEHLYCSIRACVLNHAAPDTERMGFQTSKAFFIHKRQPYFFNISAINKKLRCIRRSSYHKINSDAAVCLYKLFDGYSKNLRGYCIILLLYKNLSCVSFQADHLTYPTDTTMKGTSPASMPVYFMYLILLFTTQFRRNQHPIPITDP